MDISHFGKTPSELCDAILDGLSALKVQGDVGVVQTIGRVRGDKLPDLQAALASGLPAILLHFVDGKTDEQSTHGRRETDDLKFQILCIAGQMSTVAKRQGSSDRDYTKIRAKDVGVEQLQDWGRYFTLRALRGANAQRPRTLGFTQGVRIAADAFVGAVRFACSREFDIWDDATAVYLEQLGICHDPTNGEGGPWFEGDNETPISDWPPPGTDGGVADL
jgi:hypothetical protein